MVGCLYLSMGPRGAELSALAGLRRSEVVQATGRRCPECDTWVFGAGNDGLEVFFLCRFCGHGWVVSAAEVVVALAGPAPE